MGDSEPECLALYNRLGEVVGPEHAETLMSSLPAQPAVELATRSDIKELRSELRAEFLEIHKLIHRQNQMIIGAMVALTAIFSVVVGLIT